MNKKIKTIVFSVLILIVIGIACSVLLKVSTHPYTKVIKKNWQIELPSSGARDLYSYSEPSPHGDGIRYHVIDYEIDNGAKRVEASVLQLEKIFDNAQQPTEDQISYAVQLLQRADIKDAELPDWTKCKLVYQKQADSSEIFMFYWDGTGTLYVVESFL